MRRILKIWTILLFFIILFGIGAFVVSEKKTPASSGGDLVTQEKPSLTTSVQKAAQQVTYIETQFAKSIGSVPDLGNSEQDRHSTSKDPCKGSRINPPKEAFSVCSAKPQGTSCTFSSPNGIISGTCQTPLINHPLSACPLMDQDRER